MYKNEHWKPLQVIRIKHRWDAIDLENEQIKQARSKQKNFKPQEFTNGDTRKLLLARSRYLLYKAPSNWTENQNTRAKIIFDDRSILNYFINRSTNASTESFNAKIKAFRAQFRGVKNVEFSYID